VKDAWDARSEIEDGYQLGSQRINKESGFHAANRLLGRTTFLTASAQCRFSLPENAFCLYGFW
jgi:hypothetical protein